jgi:hypothetical protein
LYDVCTCCLEHFWSLAQDFSLVSLQGSKPTDADWEAQLAVIDTSGGVTVFEKALDAKDTKVDLKLVQAWLQDDFSSSLSTLAISRVLNSPKPTRYAHASSLLRLVK